MAVFLALSLSLAGCGSNNDHIERQQTLKQQGMELQLSGDYSGAIEKYEKALSLADMKVGEAEIDLAYYKASVQYRSGDLTGAIDTYSAILAFEKSDETYLGRGLLYMAAGEAKKAEEDLNKALDKTKDPLIRGIIYNVVEQPEKAKKCFEEAEKEGDSKGLFYLANVYEKTGDHETAMEFLEEYISGENVDAEGCLSTAGMYFSAGDYEKALSAVQKGIALGDSGVLKNLLQEEIACYEKQGDFAGARAKTEEYLENYPDDALMQKEYEFLKSR